MTDLVERLREMGEHPCRSELPMGADLREAADLIEELEAEVERLRGAFAKGVGPDDPAGCPGDNGDSCCGYHEMCRAALAKGE